MQIDMFNHIKGMMYFKFNSCISEIFSELNKEIMSSIGSMNAVINNNRKLLKNGKRKPFTKSLGSHEKSKDYKPYVFPEVSPHVLRRIRIRMRRQNRRLLIKQIIIATIAGSIVLYWFYCIQYS